MDEARYNGVRVLVTGATGFLGRHLVRALVARGARVHALTRRERQPPASAEVEWHVADLLDAPSLRSAVTASRPAITFHLAAYGTSFDQRDRNLCLRVNVEGSLNLWRALEGEACRFVHTGSCGEYGQAMGQVSESAACEPTWFYPATKNASVVLLSTLGRESGREIVTLRPFGPYGSGDTSNRIVPHTIVALLRGETVRVTAGQQRRDYAHVDDHVQAFLAAGIASLRRNAVIYNVGSDEVITVRQLLETIALAVGGESIKRIAFGAMPYRDSEVWDMCGDISAARADLGYSPTVTLGEGIGRTVSWFREHAAEHALS